MKHRVLVTALAATTLFATGFLAAEINAQRFPHMAAAHRFGAQAFEELNLVDRSHGPEVDSHVRKAQQLLRDANHELEVAADIAEHHR
jgi:hypothetical protein